MGAVRFCVGRVCRLVIITVLGISSALAEGVFHLGSALNQPLSSTTNIYIHVPNDGDIIRVHLCRQDSQANAITADIYNTTVNAAGLFNRNTKLADLDSPVANISCSDSMTSPLPQTTATGNVMEFVAPTAGVYFIDLAPTSVEYTRWDFSVVPGGTPNAAVDATANPGNLFSYQWRFYTRSFAKSASATGQMYILVPGGFANTNYVWALDLHEFSGNKYDIVANDIGVNDPVSGISAPESGNSLTLQYPVYLNYPSGANPQPAPSDFPTLTDGLVFVDDSGNDAVISPDGDMIEETGNFIFTPDVSGTYAITIDINRDGVFGANDRLLLGRMTENVLSVVNWDGTDASGAIVPNASYPVRLELRVGEYHFVATDAETSGGGSNDDGAVNEGGSGVNDGLTILQATDANTLTPTQIYWDDETLLGGDSNLPNGILSSLATTGAHRHTWGKFASDGIGDESFIDTHVFGNSSVVLVTAIVAAANTAPTIDDGIFNIDENVSVNTLVDQVSAADIDLDFLSFSITVGNTGNAFSIDDLTGEIRVNGPLDADSLDQYVLTVRVTDQANEAFATITININDLNEGPSIAGTPITTIPEDTSYSFTPTANDPESDPLTFSVSGLPAWALFDSDDGSITGIPDNDDVGLYENIIITVTSAGPFSASLPAFSIQVTNVNDDPIAVNDTATTNEDSSVSISVLTNDSDPENDPLTVTSASASNGTVVINANGSLSYTPVANFNGSDTINYSISDGNGGADSATVSLSVTPVNDVPIALNDSASTTEDSSVTISILINDSDPDNDPLTVTSASASNGAVVINANGSLSYTPVANFNGSDTINYSISDGNGGADSATVSLSVTPVNDDPIALNDSATTDEDSSVSISVLTNDSDPENDPLTVTSASASNGTVVINANGSLSYTPVANFNGNDTINYSISDGNGGSDSATVALSVTPVNDAPVAVNDSATTDEDSSVTINILTNDSDPENDPLTVTAASAANGTVVINANGSLSYTPVVDFNGNDTINYSISDGNGGSASATVALSVTPVNDAPVAINDSATTNEDSSVTINILTNDSDPENDPLTVTSASAANGTVVINPDGSVSYTPFDDFNGTDSITYIISDGNGGTHTATVTITVNAINDRPQATNDAATTVEDNSINISALVNDSDVDGDALSIVAVSDVINGTVSFTAAQVTFTPAENFNGNVIFNYTISDGTLEDSADISISITPDNDAPIALNDAVTTEENNSVVINVLANDSDVDIGDVLTVISASAVNGSTAINPDKSLTYTPNNNFSGSDTISYTISDGNTGEAAALVNVTVTPSALTISGIPALSIYEGVSYSFVPSTSTSASASLVFSVTGLPSWASFNPETGEITGTPVRADVGIYSNIVICVTNGSSTECLPAFEIEVIGDLDQDGIADDEDDDIDGDGMSNDYENENGLDPYDGSDVGEDADGDGVSNGDEHDNGTDPNVDDYGPELFLPEDVTVDAIELFNLVDIGSPEAFDFVDSVRVACCEDAINDAPERFQPGTTEVLWTVADAAGNETTGIQLVHVRPLISFAPDFSVNEGNESVVTIYLNGESPQYPIEVPYTITGGSASPGEDYIWSSGIAIIESGTEVELPLSIVQDTDVEGDETILAEIDASVNRAAKFEIEITISEENLPPEATLMVSQNNEINLQVTVDGGLVSVLSEVTDPNNGDTHSYDWSQSDDRLVDQSDDESQFMFDPSNLELGGYRVELIVTDSGTPELSDTVTANIQLVEVVDDDNIACNLALEEAAVEDAFIVEAQPGICIEQGVFSLNSELGGVWITDNDFVNQAALIADETPNIGGRFDVTVSELQAMASQVTLVIPQRTMIIEETLYRVFINGIWQDFDLINGDQVMSAPGALGFCPPPSDGTFAPGLNIGDYCVAITITDGGANDGDGLVNGIIEATGGVHQQAEPEVIDPVEENEEDIQVDIVTIGGGGSGSTGGILVVFLAGLFLVRRYSSQI